MNIGRRDFILTTGAAAVAVVGTRAAAPQRTREMYGLIGKMTAVPDRRDALIAIYGRGSRPGRYRRDGLGDAVTPPAVRAG
jgi:hypothetical protein